MHPSFIHLSDDDVLISQSLSSIVLAVSDVCLGIGYYTQSLCHGTAFVNSFTFILGLPRYDNFHRFGSVVSAQAMNLHRYVDLQGFWIACS